MATRILSLVSWLGIALVLIALVTRHGFVLGEQYAYYMLAVGMACVIACVLGQWRGIAKIFDRRITRYGALAATGLLIVLGVFGATRQSRLSDQTLTVLARLDAPLQIMVFAGALEVQQWQDELREYQYASKRVSAEYVNPDTQPAIAKQYQVQQYGTAVFTYKGRTELVTTNTEQALSNGIVRIISDQQRKVYFTSGHGEHDTGSSGPGGYSAISTALRHEHFTVDTVVLSQQGAVPDDAAVVVAAGPRTDFSPGEIDALTRYLGNNGKLLMEFDPPEKSSDPPLTNLIALAHDWGFDVGNDLIIDASGMGRIIGTDASVPLAVNYPTHPITQGFTLLTGFPIARSVSPVTGGVNGRSPQTFVETGPQSWAEADVKGLVATGQATVAFDEAKGDKKGPVSIAAAVSAPSIRSDRGDAAGMPAVGARVAVVGDSDFASNSAAAMPGNKDLFLNTIGWLSPRADLISIPPNEAGNGVVKRAGKRIVDPSRVMDSLTVGTLLLFAFGLVLTAKSADGERWLRGGAVSIGDGALFSFRGRVSRSSFWSVIIPIFLSNIVLGVMGAAISIAAQGRGLNPGTSSTVVLIVLACLGVVIVAGMWISLATYAKRWHDIGHSGWMSLTLLIPFVGLLIFGYLGFSPGAAGLNKYDV